MTIHRSDRDSLRREFRRALIFILSLGAPGAGRAAMQAFPVPPTAGSAPLSAAAAPQAAPAFVALAPAAVPSAIPTSPLAGLASAPDSAPAASGRPEPEIESRASSAFWDGAARADVVAGDGPAALGRLAEPLRTAAQLRRLADRPRGDGERFRFAVIGDAEPGRFWISRRLFNGNPGVFWRMLPRADRAGADFIIQLGDMVSRGVARRFWDFVWRLRGAMLRTPYLTVIGNHDRHRPHGVSHDRLYRRLFGATDYHFDRGGWRFVVVDTSDGRLTPERLARLESALVPGLPTVVFTHMPPAPLREWTDFGPLKGAGGFKDGAEEFLRLMTERGVKRVYVGHMHGLGVLDRGGVRYVLTGGGGSPLFPSPVKDRFHHWLSIEAGPDGLVETVHRVDGSSFVLR